jgi:ABC-2 type transport system ATP-binding protein
MQARRVALWGPENLVVPVPDGADLAVRVRGLRRTYGEVNACDGLDLDVIRGEVLALLGPNGAGKTTCTEILEGYRRRDAGDVSVLGHDPAHPTARWRARLGIVLQQASDLQDLTVEESVRHFAGYYPTHRDVDEVIDAVGLSEKRRTRGGQLSGGQRRRLDVALGIIGRPELLFLDEPTTGFDPEARHEFWELITQLRDEGTTILLTTHYLEEAEVLADRVAVICRGRVIACDVPSRLGGRDESFATVAWAENGAEQRVDTPEPTAEVARLAARFGGEVPGLEVLRPSLEDVYLSLIDTSPGAAARSAAAAITPAAQPPATQLSGPAPATPDQQDAS